MEQRRELLLKSAARLYSLGVDLEGARERLRKLVDAGVSYDSAEIRQALTQYTELKDLWDSLEQAYLQLRNNEAGK